MQSQQSSLTQESFKRRRYSDQRERCWKSQDKLSRDRFESINRGIEDALNKAPNRNEWMCPKRNGIITRQTCQQMYHNSPGRECADCPNSLKLASERIAGHRGKVSFSRSGIVLCLISAVVVIAAAMWTLNIFGGK